MKRKKVMKLEVLILGSRQPLVVDGDFSRLDNLKRLEIVSKSPEGITNIDSIKGIGYLHKLKTLHLSIKNIPKFPNFILDLKSLEKLYIEGNNIKIIPNWISTLKKLKYINLYNTSITSLPRSILELNLEEFYYPIRMKQWIQERSLFLRWLAEMEERDEYSGCYFS
ncbi:MAG: leucine-rich repeat domain-containing protein [Promethearchaeota archaeon]